MSMKLDSPLHVHGDSISMVFVHQYLIARGTLPDFIHAQGYLDHNNFVSWSGMADGLFLRNRKTPRTEVFKLSTDRVHVIANSLLCISTMEYSP